MDRDDRLVYGETPDTWIRAYEAIEGLRELGYTVTPVRVIHMTATQARDGMVINPPILMDEQFVIEIVPEVK